MKKLKLLIIGSNFGKYHLNASIKSKKFDKIIISSPNILKKKLPKKIYKYKNFRIPLKNSKIDMITIATKPKIQNKVLKYLLQEKIFPKYIFLEKPLLKESISILKKFPKKSHILTNFIFLFSNKWKIFQKKIMNSNFKGNFEYNWFFKQAYFVNKKKTWKTNPIHGGGLINYYLPHAIFNILSIYKNVKFIEIIKKRYHQNLLTFLEIKFLLNKNFSILRINNNSNINLHKLEFNISSNNINLTICNKSNKWLSNFKIYSQNKQIDNTKKISSSSDGREKILIDIYSKINSYFSTKNVETNKSLTYKTFELINKINKTK
tara:strand:+ start:123 stop:1082 length:960 start_codon:yes stop_codon:yes gene_type:complete